VVLYGPMVLLRLGSEVSWMNSKPPITLCPIDPVWKVTVPSSWSSSMVSVLLP